MAMDTQQCLVDQKVWVEDASCGFILGNIIDITEDGAVIQPLDSNLKPITSSYDDLFPAEEDNSKEVDDNCGLMFLNEATLLHNLRTRYGRDKIYTYVANILIAINPYSDIKNLFSSDTIKKYKGRSLGTLPPHIFAVADKAFRDIKVLKESQSIIVSGESGAGKTESTKYILKYLCDNFGEESGSLEQKILNSNPILEAFGNAKTTRNNNSSRFGKFIEIHFSGSHAVAGGFISHYLLERARVISQNKGERNYHIFYQLCAGAPDDLKQSFQLQSPDQFRYLECEYITEQSHKKSSKNSKNRTQYNDPLLDDVNNFHIVDKDLANIGLNDEERFSIYNTIAVVLHLGNICFEDNQDDNRGGCMVTSQTENSLEITSKLMGLDKDDLRHGLTARIMQTNKGGHMGTVIMVPLKAHEASNARDALAKSLYSRLFDYIVLRINQSIPFEASRFFIGILDIAGFEYFKVNSFEQFCINYCNEKLQQFFNQRILKDEQDLYQKEGLGVKNVNFVDNQDCIDLIERKNTGIFSLLDEESKLPKSNFQHFTEAVHKSNSQHFRLSIPRKSKIREHREIRDDDGFLIRHFAGAVCYQTKHFIEKNNDALHTSLEALTQECDNNLIQELFNDGTDSGQKRGKLTFISVGSKFQSQLKELMEKLRSTGTNFIRCIKPNVRMVAQEFDGSSILSQLQCAGMTSVLQLMQKGYPSRCQFSSLYDMYKGFLPQNLVRLDPRLFCKALFKALGLNDLDFKFGLTKVFFRPGKFAEFDQIMKSDPENMKILISQVTRWLLRSRWRKVQWCALSVIKLKNKIIYRHDNLIIIQKNARMYLAKKQHAPRYKGLMKINKMEAQVDELKELIQNLKKEKDSSLNNLKVIEDKIFEGKFNIKSNENIKPVEISRLIKDITDKIKQELTSVKSKIAKQKLAEEQARLKKLQEEMELERKKKEEEEAMAKLLQEEKRLRAEIESRRKKDVETKKEVEQHQVKEHSTVDSSLNHRMESLSTENSSNKQNNHIINREQERRDHELALRLAKEMNSDEDDKYESPRKNAESPKKPSPPAATSFKFDLSKWKYAELRDTINTSCDIDLLEACREEFHRRLKVYHTWKTKNKSNKCNQNSRAPHCVLAEAGKTSRDNNGTIRLSNEQRYFRIPFLRPNSDGTKGVPGQGQSWDGQGWWLAHFDGQWISRQMELHPSKQPIVLTAGRDDMQMCELSLEETGLTRKKGAEILQQEFEREWNKYGGAKS